MNTQINKTKWKNPKKIASGNLKCDKGGISNHWRKKVYGGKWIVRQSCLFLIPGEFQIGQRFKKNFFIK